MIYKIRYSLWRFVETIRFKQTWLGASDPAYDIGLWLSNKLNPVRKRDDFANGK